MARKPRGSIPLKVRLPGCAPVRRLSGTHDRAVLRRLVRMLHTLHEQGRDDLVNAIAAGRLKPLQVYNRWRFARLDELPHADEMPVYADTWPAWVEGLECSDAHRASCSVWCRRLAREMAPTAPIGDAIRALQAMRASYRAHPRSFNLARTTLLAFFRDTVGRRHAFWTQAADVKPLRAPPKRVKHPLTPDALRVLVRALGDPWGGMAWTMAVTGMGWKEYTGAWETEGAGLRIHGTKTGGRDRLIPLVSLLFRPEGTIHAFRYHLTRASAGRVRPYDLRRTFAGLMVEAGIPRPRRRAYMGHGADDILAIYEFQEVLDYLVRDAERIRAILGEPEGGLAGLRRVAG